MLDTNKIQQKQMRENLHKVLNAIIVKQYPEIERIGIGRVSIPSEDQKEMGLDKDGIFIEVDFFIKKEYLKKRFSKSWLDIYDEREISHMYINLDYGYARNLANSVTNCIKGFVTSEKFTVYIAGNLVGSHQEW